MWQSWLWIIMSVTGILVACGAYIWFAFRPPAPLQSATATFTLPDVTLITPGLMRQGHQNLHVRDGVIQRIETATTSSRADDDVSRFAGAYVLPGLVDMHTHLPPDSPLKLTGQCCFLYLAHGVTSVREAGDIDGTAVPAARKGIDSGDFPGPRIFACGPFVGGEPASWANTLIVKQPGDAAMAVAQLKEEGYQAVKSYDNLTVAQIRELKTAAEQHGLPVLGHVPTELSYEEALVPDVQHLFGVPEPRSLARPHVVNRLADWQDVDDARLDLIVETTLTHGITNTPTLVVTQQLLHYADYQTMLSDPIACLVPRLYRGIVWHPVKGLPIYRELSDDDLARLEASLVKKKALVQRLYEAGASLLIGTDVQQPFVVPGASVHQEMQLFNDSGIPPEEVWAIATWKAGQALGMSGLGTVQVGAPADLLIFREDPTQELAALNTLEAVIAQGHLYTREAIDAAKAAYQKKSAGFVYDQLSVFLTQQILRRTMRQPQTQTSCC